MIQIFLIEGETYLVNPQKELANSLQIALGSSHELEYQLLLAKDLKFIQEEKYLELEKKVGEIKAMLISLIKKVRI